eukprot:s881_g6.t1
MRPDWPVPLWFAEMSPKPGENGLVAPLHPMSPKNLENWRHDGIHPLSLGLSQPCAGNPPDHLGHERSWMFHQGPQVLPVSHHLCGAGGAAFFLSCLAQRAADVEVIYEEQCFPQPILRRKKFKEALRDLDARSASPMWLCDETLVATMDVDEFGLAELPGCNQDILKCFSELGPPSSCALWFATTGASSCWRRDPVCWSTQILVLLGSATIQLEENAPTAAVVSGLSGLGAAAVAPAPPWDSVAPKDLLTVPAGQMLVIPPGWWYALSCSEKLLAIQMQSLRKEDATWALAKLLTSLGQSPRSDATPEQLAQDAAAAVSAVAPEGFQRCLRGLFPLPTKFELFSEASQQRLLDVMWELSAVHPEIVSAGLGLPRESISWSRQSLEVFVVTAGFWRPPRAHAPPSQFAFPRIIWMFWAQGDDKGLGLFRRACIQSWVCNNPGWRVVLLSASSCFSFIATSDLPEKWQSLRWDVLSDAVRLALLARHGGVYVDVSVVCTKPLDDWLKLSSSATDIDLEAFYYPKFGRSDRTNTGEFVENWFLASPKCSELMQRWHAAFLQFWKGRTDATQDGGLLASSMFKGIDLQAMREDQTNYLTMHCCFKWLIDSDPVARQRWQTATALHSGDAAIGWICELGGVEQDWNETNVACLHAARWLYKNDTAWVSELIQRAPMLKFVGAHASIFDKQPEQNLMHQGTCMCFLLNHSVAWSTRPEVLEFETFEVVN